PLTRLHRHRGQRGLANDHPVVMPMAYESGKDYHTARYLWLAARRSHGYKMLRLLRSLFRVRSESSAPKRSTSGMYCDRFFSSIEYLPHNDGKNQMSTPVQR